MCDCTAGSPVFSVSKEHARTEQTENCLTACTLQTKAHIVRNVGNQFLNDAASRLVLQTSYKTDTLECVKKFRILKW